MRTHVYKKTLGKRNRTRHVINAEREVLHVAKGDTVKVVRGDDKGKEGKIIRVYPKTGRVLIEGINIVKKHRKARTAEELGISLKTLYNKLHQLQESQPVA